MSGKQGSTAVGHVLTRHRNKYQFDETPKHLVKSNTHYVRVNAKNPPILPLQNRPLGQLVLLSCLILPYGCTPIWPTGLIVSREKNTRAKNYARAKFVFIGTVHQQAFVETFLGNLYILHFRHRTHTQGKFCKDRPIRGLKNNQMRSGSTNQK